MTDEERNQLRTEKRRIQLERREKRNEHRKQIGTYKEPVEKPIKYDKNGVNLDKTSVTEVNTTNLKNEIINHVTKPNGVQPSINHTPIIEGIIQERTPAIPQKLKPAHKKVLDKYSGTGHEIIIPVEHSENATRVAREKNLRQLQKESTEKRRITSIIEEQNKKNDPNNPRVSHHKTRIISKEQQQTILEKDKDQQRIDALSEMDSIRYEITSLDENILSFLERRFELTNRIGEIKVDNHLMILDTNRENELIHHLKNKHTANGGDDLDACVIEGVWKAIFKESCECQNKHIIKMNSI